MKNMKSFIEYTKYSKLVTEAVLDTARAGQARTNVKFDPARPFEQQRDQMLAGRWAGVSPRLIIGLMRFSRKWKSELDMCQIDRLPVSEEKFKIAAQLNGQSGMTVKDISEGGLKFKLEMQFPGKAQGIFMGNFRKRFPTAKTEFNGGFIRGAFDDEITAANAFWFAQKIKTENYIPEKGEAVAWLESPADMPAEMKDAYAQAVRKEGGNQAQRAVQLTGPVDPMNEAFNMLSDGNAKFDDLVKITSNTTSVTYDMIWLVDQVVQRLKPEDKPENILVEMRAKRFGVVFNKEVDNIISDVAQATGEKKAQDKNIDVKVFAATEFDRRMNALKFENILNQVKNVKKVDNEYVEAEPLPQTPTARRRLKLFDDAEYFGAEILKSANWIFAIVRSYPQAHTFVRFKPKVDKNGNIIADANLRSDEMAEKIKKGELNSEGKPWDKAYMAKMLDIRDSPGHQYVADGYETAYPRVEACWCVCGSEWYTRKEKSGIWENAYQPDTWENSYFLTDKRGELHPFIVLMNCRDGMLYGTNLKYSGEKCQRDNFEDESNSSNPNRYNKLKSFLRDPEFQKIYLETHKRSLKPYRPDKSCGSRKHGISNPPSEKWLIRALGLPIRDETFEQRLAKVDVTDDGQVLVKSREDFEKNADVILHKMVTRVRLDFEDASRLFENRDASNLDVIDCSKVTNAAHMFKNTVFARHQQADGKILDLVSTAKVENMGFMFDSCTGIRKLIGLDTSSAVDMGNFMNALDSFRQRALVLPVLDVGKCVTMQNAFKDSPVEEIRLRNTGNVEYATDMCTGCFLLKSYPTMDFPLIKSFYQLKPTAQTITYENQHELAKSVIDGCDILTRDIGGTDEFADKLVRQYGLKELETQEFLNLPVLKKREDVDLYMANIEKYRRGFRLAPDDGNAESWFSNREVGAVDVVDLNGVVDATSLFDGATIKFQRVFGAGNIKKADRMFYTKNFMTTMPDVNFKSCESANLMFSPAWQGIRAIKRGSEYYTKLNPDTLSVPGIDPQNATVHLQNYMFGVDSANVLRARFGESLDHMFEDVAGKALDNAINAWIRGHYDENGKLVISGVDSYIEYSAQAKKYGERLKKPSGFALDPQFAEKQKNLDGVFSAGQPDEVINVNGMEIDLGGIKNARGLFKKKTLHGAAKWTGYQNLQNIEEMFCEAKIDVMPPAEMFAGVKSARSAFAFCKCKDPAQAAGIVWENLQDACDVFHYFDFKGQKICPAKTMPKARDISFAFAASRAVIVGENGKLVVQAITGNGAFGGCELAEAGSIELPNAVTCPEMFIECVLPPEIDSISAPKATDMTSFMKYRADQRAAGLKVIGRLYAPACISLVEAFSGRTSLAFIAKLDFPTTASMNNMFKDTPLADVYGASGRTLRAFLGQ